MLCVFYSTLAILNFTDITLFMGYSETQPNVLQQEQGFPLPSAEQEVRYEAQ